MHKLRIAGLALIVAGAAGAAGAISSCAATTTNEAVRTFEAAQKVDVVCLQVNDANGNQLAWGGIRALPQNECAQVPANTNGAALPNHLYALVTQTTRGELAAVDLTAGSVIDEDRATPGINFIPVGANPTDVAVSPDAQLVFVSSADPNKPAIYAMASTRTVGSTVGGSPPPQSPPPLRLPDLAWCALPQAPQALAIAPLSGASGTDSGTPSSSKYALIALLRPSPGSTDGGSPVQSAKVVAIDPSTFMQQWAVPGNGATQSNPGAVPPCPVLGATQLSSALPATWSAGPAWPDGVPYADAGNVTAASPLCSATSSDGGALGDDAGASAGGVEAGAGASDAGAATAGFALSTGPIGTPRPASMAMREDIPILYVADSVLPVIHVVDVSNPAAPTELPPLLATSLGDPTRRVVVGAIAVSPATHDYKRYLYAIDSSTGSLMVFDVSIARPTAPATPMTRPHAELNPFVPPDRLTFPAPVATVAFVLHDWPLVLPSDPQHAYQGLICNPNPLAHPSALTFSDLGAYYAVDQVGTAAIQQSQGTVQGLPYRLRGVFAFATLTNGTMVTIDVDDWDAPCRRPDPMAISDTPTAGGVYFGMTGALDLPQPDAGDAGDLDPYHAPFTFRTFPGGSAAVTQEAFFPVSTPNRMRSNFLLRNDPISGQHLPNLVGNAQLFDVNGAPVSSAATGGAQPLILPTGLPATFIDPSYIQNPTAADPSTYTTASPALASAAGQAAAPGPSPLVPGHKTTAPPGVRISFDEPTVHADQDWTVAYEGALPNALGLLADASSKDGYDSLTLTATGASFCERGIEDWSVGKARADAAVAAMTAAGLTPPQDLDKWTSDYIEITDDLLTPDDVYWTLPSSSENACWDFPISGGKTLTDPPGSAKSSHAQERYATCQAQFGSATDADTHLSRDFPVVRAFDDHLILGRFAFPDGTLERTTNRTVTGPDASNAPFLKAAACCFHQQFGFKVRSGGEWVTVGQGGFGLLHHVVADPSVSDPHAKACILSCDPRKALLNARAFDVPWADPGKCTTSATNVPAFDRTETLAMRNPFFSFVMWSGCGPLTAPDHTLSTRDLNWRFSMRGGFAPLTFSLAGNTAANVIPQSMRFIGSLGQLAVVDGAQQGLILIDLNTINFAHTPYF